MMYEKWDYDKKSHQIILNVKGDKRRQRRKNKRIKTAMPLLVNRPRALVLVVILVILAFTFLREAKTVLAESPIFMIRHIQFKNTEFLNPKILMRLLAFKKGADSLFSISARELSRRLKKDPDIKNAVVEKCFPDTLKITIDENIPYVKIRDSNKDYFLDYKGAVLLRNIWGNKVVPLIIGLGKAKPIPGRVYSGARLKIALDVIHKLEQLGLKNFIQSEVVNVSDIDNIIINTREKISILAGYKYIDKEFKKLVLVLSDCRKRGRIIKKIDLRHKDVYVE